MDDADGKARHVEGLHTLGDVAVEIGRQQRPGLDPLHLAGLLRMQPSREHRARHGEENERREARLCPSAAWSLPRGGFGLA
jgi:hypothetical protein